MEHAVIVHIKLDGGAFGADSERDAIESIEALLETAIATALVGEFDGDEFGGHECVLYAYGPDADRLFAVMQPILAAAPIVKGGYAIKRYGEAADSRAIERRVDL
jgi:hypothetical protein